MRVLQICNKPPYPPVDGGAIAMNNTTKGLLDLGIEVHVLCITTAKHPVNIHQLPKDYLNKTHFKAVFIDTSIKIKAAFFNLFTQQSYNIQRFISSDFTDALQTVLTTNRFDLVILESLFVCPYIPSIRNFSKAKIVLRAHNIEHKIWERYALNTNNLFKKKYLKLLAKRLKHYEKKVIQEIDAITAITAIDERDFLKLGFNKNITTIPVGYSLEDNIPQDQYTDFNSLFHIASMDWLPNLEGLDWFLKEIWDAIHHLHPELKLYLAGRNMPNKYLKLKRKNIINLGEVESAKDFYMSKNIMIVPIQSGSGMRIKIIEGMALGKTIISTSIGAEGIQCTSNKNIILADTAKEFTQAIHKCITNPALCKSIGNEARKLVAEKYNNERISKEMKSFLEAQILS